MAEPAEERIEVSPDRALAELALAVRRLDLGSFTREAARRIREGLGVEHCRILRCVEGTPLPRAGAGEALASSVRPPPAVGDARGRLGSRWGGPSRGVGVSVVVRAGGRAFGVLSVYSASRRGYTKEEAGFLRGVAELLGVAAERALVVEAHRRAVGEERRRADAAEEKYAFLHEANAVLAAAPDGLAALAAARLAVPTLADACFVDLVEAHAPTARVRRFLVVRPDGAGEGSAQEFSLRYPLDPGAPHGTPKVLRTGQPELIPEMREGVLDCPAGSRENRDLIHHLTPGSYLCVPLQVGPRLVGSMGFISAATGRHGGGDLALAECLARCTALVAANPPGRGMVRQWDAGSPTALDREPVLTPRQLEVLRMLARGMRVRDIKAELGLSEPTVRTHVRGILRALGACSQLEALHRARVLGLVDGRPEGGERP